LLSKNIKTKIYRNIILLVLYGYETWSLTLKAKNRLRVFEKRVPKKIFGPKGAEVIGECRRLHYVQLYEVYSSTNITTLIK
jgi:hypothetical protein